MTDKKPFITNVLIYLVVLLGLYFTSNIVGIDISNYSRPFLTSEYITIFILFALLTSLLIFVEVKLFDHRWCRVLLLFIAAIFLINVFTIFLAPSSQIISVVSHQDGKIYTKTYTLLMSERWYYLLSLVVGLVCLYLFIGVIPRKIHSLQILNIFTYLGMFVIIAAFIYSYITEWQYYIYFFTNPSCFNAVCSFFKEKNNYAMILTFAIVALLYVHSTHPKWYILVFIGFIFLNVIFTLSKINIVIDMILIVGYLIGRFFITYKEYKKRNLITLGVFVTCIIFITIFFVLIVNNVFPSLKNFAETLRTFFKDWTGTTFLHRTYIWENVVTILNNSSWIFGAGYGVFNGLLYTYNTADVAFPDNKTELPHNAFLQMIGEGGILLLVLFIILFVYVLYATVKISKNHKTVALITFLFFFTYLLHMVFDSNMPLLYSCNPRVDSLLLALFLFAPSLSIYYHEKHPEISNELKQEKKSNQIITYKVVSTNLDVYKLINIILWPILFVVIAIISDINHLQLLSTSNLILVISLGVIALFVPFIIFLITHKIDDIKEYITKGLLPYLLLSLALFIPYHLCILYIPVGTAVVPCLSVIYLFLYLFVLLFTPFKKSSSLPLINIIKKMESNLIRFHRYLVKD